MLAPIFGSWNVRVCEAQEMKKEVGNILNYFLKTMFFEKIPKILFKNQCFRVFFRKNINIRSLGNYQGPGVFSDLMFFSNRNITIFTWCCFFQLGVFFRQKMGTLYFHFVKNIKLKNIKLKNTKLKNTKLKKHQVKKTPS